MNPTRRGGLLLLLVVAASVGCGGYRTVRSKSPVDLYWPRDDPRVRLESLIDLQDTKSRGSARILSWLGGQEQVPRLKRPYGLAWDGEYLWVADARGAHRPALGLLHHPVQLPAHRLTPLTTQ